MDAKKLKWLSAGIAVIGISALTLHGCLSGGSTSEDNNGGDSVTYPTTGDGTASSYSSTNSLSGTYHDQELCIIAGYDSTSTPNGLEGGVETHTPSALYQTQPAKDAFNNTAYPDNILAGKSNQQINSYKLLFKSNNTTTPVTGSNEVKSVSNSYDNKLAVDSALNLFFAADSSISNREFNLVTGATSANDNRPVYLRAFADTQTNGNFKEAKGCLNLLAPTSSNFVTSNIMGKKYGNAYSYANLSDAQNPKAVTVSYVVQTDSATPVGLSTITGTSNEDVLTPTSFSTSLTGTVGAASGTINMSTNGSFSMAVGPWSGIKGFFTPDGLMGVFSMFQDGNDGNCDPTTSTTCKTVGTSFMVQLPSSDPTSTLAGKTYKFRGISAYNNQNGTVNGAPTISDQGTGVYNGGLTMTFNVNGTATLNNSYTLYHGSNMSADTSKGTSSAITVNYSAVDATNQPGVYNLTFSGGTVSVKGRLMVSSDTHYILLQMAYQDSSNHDNENGIAIGTVK